MLTEKRGRGRPPVYPFRDMAVGDSIAMPAPAAADVKRIARNASQFGLRVGRRYQCSTDLATRILTVTRTQ